MLKILLIDDHTLFRELLIPALDCLDTDVIIYEAESISTGLNLLKVVKQIDLILLDLRFPGEHSWNSFPFNNTALKAIPIIILTASMRIDDFKIALEKGCKGYITKSTSKRQLISGINTILSGQTWFSSDVLATLGTADVRAGFDNNLTAIKIRSLSNRQNEILNHLTRGYTNLEIAQLCGISEGTVKLHVSTILKVLGVSNRTQAVIKANEVKGSREEKLP